MSWTTSPIVPERKTGSSWSATEPPVGRAVGRGWFSPDFIEKVTALTATATLHATVATSYPYSTAGLSSSGALTAIVRPKLAIAAAFTGLGTLRGPVGELKRTAVAFSAEGGLDGVINDGLWAIVIGGVAREDGLTATVGGGVFDGLSATVVPGVPSRAADFAATGSFTPLVTGGAGTPVAAPLSATGSLAATVKPRFLANADMTGTGTLAATALISSPAAFTGAGALSATVSPVAATTPALSGSGTLSATVTQLITYADYIDLFNRANAATLGANWTNTSSTPGTNKFKITSNAAKATTTNPTSASYVLPMNTDYWVKVTVVLASDVNPADYLAIFLRSNNTSRQIAFLWQASTLYIQTNNTTYDAAISGVGTARATNSKSFAPGDTLVFEAKGNTYTASRNDVTLATWVDNSSAYAYDSTNREVAIAYWGSTANVGGFDSFEAQEFPNTIAATAALSSGGTLSATAKAQASYSPALTSEGTLTASAYDAANPPVVIPVSAPLAGTGTLAATVAKAFTPITDDNINRANVAVPAGTSGCWVTLIGAGGAGGSAGSLTDQNTWQYGGAGGGGGGRINRYFIPVASLGATYTVNRGVPVAGGNGNASTFSSGGKILTAGGGQKGANGSTAGYAAGGTGGTWSQSGLTGVTGENGGDGNGGMFGDGSGTNSTNAGAGGGWGAYTNTFGAGDSGYPSAPGSGGSSSTRTGGAGGAVGANGSAPTAATATNGGAGGGGGGSFTTVPGNGGAGGNFGGAGGGQGAGTSGTLNTAGAGTGFTRVEWV